MLIKRAALEQNREAVFTISPVERAFFFDNLLVRIHFNIMMIRWSGLAPQLRSSRTARLCSPCLLYRQEMNVNIRILVYLVIYDSG